VDVPPKQWFMFHFRIAWTSEFLSDLTDCFTIQVEKVGLGIKKKYAKLLLEDENVLGP
jgi:hypothetical protein